MAFDHRDNVPEEIADACADIFTICRGIPILHRRWPCGYEPDGCELEASQGPEEPRYKRRWPVFRDHTEWIYPVPEYQVDIIALLRDCAPFMEKYGISLAIFRANMVGGEAMSDDSIGKVSKRWGVCVPMVGEDCYQAVAREFVGDAIVLAMARILKEIIGARR